MKEPAWKKYLYDYNEGLGLVYERFVLEDYLESLLARYPVRTVLEAPLYGMAGVSGINSVPLARAGCRVTLADSNAERLAGVKRIWAELGLEADFILLGEGMAPLPFPDRTFDLVWQWAGLWYMPDAGRTLRELARVSNKLLFLAMPNRFQVGYLLRKYLVDRTFFKEVDERWAEMGRIKKVLKGEGVEILEEGVLDVPPWPDTVMPAAEFLKKLGIKSKKLEGRFTGSSWHWSTMDYYLGRRPDLQVKVMRYAFLDKAPLPWWIKVLWAHHRYILGKVK
ncbi:MAG: class I SAM-dependent methyltransferase [Anaerolineae bacterium]